MKFIHLPTYLTAEEADCLYQYLSDLRQSIWKAYGDDIVKIRQDASKKENQEFDNNLPDDH